MSEKQRLGIAVVFLIADGSASWLDRVLMVLESMGFSVEESKEAVRMSGLGD